MVWYFRKVYDNGVPTRAESSLGGYPLFDDTPVHKSCAANSSGADPIVPFEMQWIRQHAKHVAQQQGISEEETERRLAQQGFRQVQFGAPCDNDTHALRFANCPRRTRRGAGRHAGLDRRIDDHGRAVAAVKS